METVDRDDLREAILQSFETVLSSRYKTSYAASRKWTSAPLRFQTGYPLGGFFKLLEADLRKRMPSLENFRIPKGQSTMAGLLGQPMSQSVGYVFGVAIVFLAKADHAKVL